MNSIDKVNILMVDDQPAKLLSYEVILKDLGENLIAASSGKEALEFLLKTDVAVVLMDVSMPDINGFELADMIRQHPRFQKTAIIFISGVHMSDMDRIRGYQRGAVDYISVPVVPELLRAKVTVFAELHRKTRQLENLNQELEERVAARNEELRRLNQQLKQRVTELETIMQVLPVGVAVAQDPACRVVTGNAALNELQGFLRGSMPSADTSPQTGVLENVYRDGLPVPAEKLPLQQAAASGKPVESVELEIRNADGTSTWLLSSADPLLDEDGSVRGAVGAFYDVTSRKRMEDTLRERADLLELASEAIMVRDLDGNVRFWNSGAENLYGWSRHEAIGRDLHGLLHTEFPITRTEMERQLMQAGSWSGNLVQRTKEGREVIVACRKSMNTDRKAVLEIIHDITRQMEVEETLRRAEKLAAMGRVAGIVAHEINNPLDAVTNTFYLLRDHPSLDEDARYLARMGEQELGRISHITKQTLSFYRESSEPVLLSIADVIDDVLELQSRVLQLNTIRLQKDYRSRGLMHGFPGELKQVFLNLIGNAIQATPAGGRIRVRLHDPLRRGKRTGTCISICDTGSGISTEHARRLFEPFFTTKATKGTGLGLWISKGIIQKYEGTIQFRSLKLPSGNVTCFNIFIPGTVSQVRGPELLDYVRTAESQ
jgi:PAS domain S-box-containing protein